MVTIIVRKTKLFLLIVCTLFISSCSTYYHFFYTDPVQCLAQAQGLKPFDAIIIPGFPYHPDSANTMLLDRIKWGAYLFRNGYAKNIIFSGSAVHSPYIEAKAMRLFALKFGIPSANIYTETKAEHTTENLYYSSELAKTLGFKSLAFATQSAQTSFMKPFNKKWKLNIYMLPIVPPLIAADTSHPSIDTASLFIPKFIPLNQREGKWESLRGTRGKKVKLLLKNKRKQNSPSE